MMLKYNTQSKSSWLFSTWSRVLQADWLISLNNEKATLNINMPNSNTSQTHSKSLYSCTSSLLILSRPSNFLFFLRTCTFSDWTVGLWEIHNWLGSLLYGSLTPCKSDCFRTAASSSDFIISASVDFRISASISLWRHRGIVLFRNYCFLFAQAIFWNNTTGGGGTGSTWSVAHYLYLQTFNRSKTNHRQKAWDRPAQLI